MISNFTTSTSTTITAAKASNFTCIKQQELPYVERVIWPRVIGIAVFQIAAIYGFYVAYASAQSKTVFFALAYGYVGGLGMTAGTHRLWAHNSYKAKLPLKFFLAILASICLQGSIFDWAKSHRVHHKFSDTNADPCNIKRGFFFSHLGFLMVTEHPDITAKMASIPITDLLDDPVVRLERRFNIPLSIVFSILVPLITPVWLWNETVSNSFYVAIVARLCYIYHVIFLINSAAHGFGYRPYNKSIEARDNALIHFITLGEGAHNYHHTFPWYYSSPEIDYVGNFNVTAGFIKLMSILGLAYDLKTATADIRQKGRLLTERMTESDEMNISKLA